MAEIDTVFSLAGGLGTRLGDLTKETPKPLVDINGRSVIEIELDWFRSFGIKKVVFGTHYKSEVMEEHLGKEYKGMELVYNKEKELLGTGGCIKFAEKLLPETFIISNADILTSFNLSDMIKQHKETGALITTGLKAVRDPRRFGVAVLDGTRITGFIEKPEVPPSNLINMGVGILGKKVLDMIPEGKVSIEREVYPKTVALGKHYGYVIDGPWIDMGIPEDLEIARKIW